MRKLLLSIAVTLLFFLSITAISSADIQRSGVAASEPPQGEEPGGGRPSSLPVMYINTYDERIYKEDVIWADFQVFENVSDPPVFESLGAAKYRGNSSYYTFDKKSYRIKFYRDENKSRDYGLFGMGPDSEWVLNGPFLDRSLLRNRLMFELSGEMLPWSPQTRYCELYVNGEYHGVYLAIEPISAGQSRLGLTIFGLSSGATPYIIGRERVGTEDNEFKSYGTIMGKTSYYPNIEYPSAKKLTSAQQNYIKRDLDTMEEALYSNYFSDPRIGYAKYIDVDSFVDYYLLNEFALIIDAFQLSTYAYKDLGGKLTMTVWDFNNGFDNYPWFDCRPEDGFILAGTNWIDRLLSDRAFTDKVVARYRELRGGLWETSHIMSILDENVEYLGDAIDRNFSVWGYTFSERLLSRDRYGEYRDPVSHEDAVLKLKAAIVARLDYMDKNIDSLYGLCIN